ncbi:hypothetical protein BBJ28_00004205 [Nothophytophthora sp. Chile5]|nr:hypothetical protein BBJ28_00004205 [Nothophytophthora sp. Chile5]
MGDARPRILVLGGAGVIGRNFVKFCVDRDLCAGIRVADKTMPEISYFRCGTCIVGTRSMGQKGRLRYASRAAPISALCCTYRGVRLTGLWLCSAAHKQAFADPRVSFVQADLTRDAHVDRAFNPDFGPYDFVFNLAGETKCGLSESVYASKCRDLSVKCAKKAQEVGVKRYVEVSTAFVYKSQAKQPATEQAELHPWTLQAKYKLEAEEEIRRLPDLKVVFLRLATFLTYVKLEEKMKLLWDAEMRVNTVRPEANSSNLQLLQRLISLTAHSPSVVIADQSKINAILEELFRIKTGFIGKLVSNLARVRLADIVDDANEKHMQPWADLCAEHGINNTPLTPYIDKELLQHNHLYVDGSKIESTGFRYEYPTTKEVRCVEWESLEMAADDDDFDSYQDALLLDEPVSLTSSTSTSPADGESGVGAAEADVPPMPEQQVPTQQMRRLKRKERLRTQSESAAWTRASLKMRPSPPAVGSNAAATPAYDGAETPASKSATPTPSAAFDYVRNSEGALPHLTKEILGSLDMSTLVGNGRDVAYRRHSHGNWAAASVMSSRERCINMWRQQGQISERASEILEDAKLSLHGKEKNLYNASLRRLSEAQDPRLNTLGERISSSTAAAGGQLLTEPSSTTSSVDGVELNGNDGMATTKNVVEQQPVSVMAAAAEHQKAMLAKIKDDRPSLDIDKELEAMQSSSTPVVDDLAESTFRSESATLYHEAVKWEGVLTRRSEWLRRLERHYYVLEGKFLRRFASKEAYLSSRDEPLVPHHIELPTQANRPVAGSPAAGLMRRNSSSPAANGVSHLYILAGVKDSSSRTNGFTFITEDKKTLQVAAPTGVEKVIWMRLGLEAIVALPTLPVAPLDMEEFYAMLVVLYTAHRGNWRTEGDMAVTLPPPSEQVFTRFFRLLDKDVIFCSNYPPSVPFHGSFRGHAGVVSFMHDFARHTLWTNFKIAGMSVDGALAVASGKEELENRRDARRFIQNWVHKFTFYSDGRLARFEINGDVVAASAVFKVPGAATTLKLPQEFNEVDAEHGLDGTLLVRVMQGHGLKPGTSVKKTVRSPGITVRLQYREQPKPKSVAGGSASGGSSSASTSTTTIGGISMPSLSRKFSFMASVASSAASAATAATGGGHSTPPNGGVAQLDPFSTGLPRNVEETSYLPTHPVWNRVLELPFTHVIGTCTLVVDVIDHGKTGIESQLGFASLNIAKYLMAVDDDDRDKAHEEAAMAADGRWYSISNAKGEYCGKVQLGITCRRRNPTETGDGVQPRLKKSQSVVIDRHNPPSSHMLQWEPTPAAHAQAMLGAATPAPNGRNGLTLDEYPMGVSEHARRHGWANVKLSPENTARTQSAGAVVSGSNDSDPAVHKRFPAAGASGSALPSANDAVVCKDNADMHTFMVCGAPFTIPRHYQLIKVCGRGAYGIVIAATNLHTGGNVAIKKVIDCIWHPHQLKQILRECRLVRHMAHENVLSLLDLVPPPSYTDFRDVYMTMDLMEMDLHRIIYSKEVLRDDHIRYFLYQMLSGLHHMHRAGVLHRDLKPSNLLINSDCQLKICDLGLARSKEAEDVGMTEYVVTRWYRAPELLLGSAYGEGVDLWAAGCIFAEMLGRKPLFPGETYVHQLQLIMNVLGVPEEHSFKENPLANKLKGRQLLSRTQAVAGIDTSVMFPNANPEALDLLWQMLVFDVEKRISVEQALRHPYLAMYYDAERENAPVEKFQSFDLDDLDETDLKELMFKEICHFHPEEMVKRAQQQREHPETVDKLPAGWVKRESRSVPGKFYYSNPKRGISTWIKEEMNDHGER